jgi:myo-inositol-1(or 4)-monophosphatase
VDSILEFAIDLAKQTGELLTERFTLSGTQGQLKGDRSIVTQADLDADRLIAEAISDHFPADGLVSEELSPRSPSGKEVVWVVDPLDGTTNFSLGLPFWGVSIARLVKGWPETAVLYFPTVGELYIAQSGRGAFLNQTQITAQVSPQNHSAAFFACCSRTHRRYDIQIKYKPRILGSSAYNLCAVARGTALMGFEAVPKIWDLSAGWLLIEEAGGAIETYSGPHPFPLIPDLDYRNLSFPIITAANRDLVSQARLKITVRDKSG